METTDIYSKSFKQKRKESIDLAVQWSESKAKAYAEPKRAGTAKGDPIGFSREKYHASCLMVLRPTLKLREIAEKAGVKYSVLRVWTTQADFQKAVDEAVEDFAGEIFRLINNLVGQKKSTGKGYKLALSRKPASSEKRFAFALDSVHLLPFYNVRVYILINERVYKSLPGFHWYFKVEMMRGDYVKSEASAKKFLENSEVRGIYVYHENLLVDQLIDPSVSEDEKLEIAKILKDHNLMRAGFDPDKDLVEQIVKGKPLL